MRPLKTLSLAIFLSLCGCQISPRVGQPNPQATGQLYVLTSNAILRFSHATAATGNIAPDASISGSSVGLSSPEGIFLDTTNDRLFVANKGASSILVFDQVSTLSGNIAPSRTISGNATHLSAPLSLVLDNNNNLYVADGTHVLVFGSASNVNGNVAPSRNFDMTTTLGQIFLDATNDQLYLAEPTVDTVERVDNASIQNGIGVASVAIVGADTGLATPTGITLDANFRLFVSNNTAPVSIVNYANAAGATNNPDVAPSGKISGAQTALIAPGQLFLNRNATNGELYVADQGAGAILVFTNVANQNGAPAPARSISGGSTQISVNSVNGVALDLTR
jgi:hypothetical protein